MHFHNTISLTRLPHLVGKGSVNFAALTWSLFYPFSHIVYVWLYPITYSLLPDTRTLGL
ncbi:hypothetical protein [Rubritalea tangerina]|uniref:hypothetical protein n=1 Tax=Rubritalea tangerina TaxID=430798 RepID=UPI00361E85D0